MDIERANYPGGEYQTPPLPTHYVVLHVGTPTRITQRCDGHTQHSAIFSGDVTIVPAYTPNVCQHLEPAEELLISLEPFLVAEVAAAVEVDPTRIELQNSFGVRDPQINEIALALLRESQSPGLGGRLYAESLTTQLIVQLLRRHAVMPRPFTESAGGLSPAHLRRVIDFISDQLEHTISLNDMAATVHLSPYHFARQFKQAIGLSPHEYLIQQRIEAAKRLLTQRDLTTTEVAAAVGFADYSHLARHFKRQVGLSPTAYRRQIANV